MFPLWFSPIIKIIKLVRAITVPYKWCLCSAVLSLQQRLEWSPPWSPRLVNVRLFLSVCGLIQSSWLGGQQQTPTTMSLVSVPPLILTHKLPVNSSPISRQSSMHPGWSLTQRIAPHLPCQSFHPSTLVVWATTPSFLCDATEITALHVWARL